MLLMDGPLLRGGPKRRIFHIKQILLILAVVALVGCSPTVEFADPIVAKPIRVKLNKPTGDLTKAQIDQLQKALPKCAIISNPTK